jgi:hypothetical protein
MMPPLAGKHRVRANPPREAVTQWSFLAPCRLAGGALPAAARSLVFPVVPPEPLTAFPCSRRLSSVAPESAQTVDPLHQDRNLFAPCEGTNSPALRNTCHRMLSPVDRWPTVEQSRLACAHSAKRLRTPFALASATAHVNETGGFAAARTPTPNSPPLARWPATSPSSKRHVKSMICNLHYSVFKNEHPRLVRLPAWPVEYSLYTVRILRFGGSSRVGNRHCPSGAERSDRTSDVPSHPRRQQTSKLTSLVRFCLERILLIPP